MAKIVWTEPAVSDLQSIVDYISRHSEYYGGAFAERILEAAESLSQFPEMGRIVPEFGRDEIRELIFQSYRIIYQIEEERILILAVIHGSRNLMSRKPKPWNIA
jgi:plasmid stabilization system protein ParE